jgi:copper chaperone CopZ
MRKIGFILPALLLAGIMLGCRQQDMRTVVVKAPGMKNSACARVIQDAFMRQQGIQSIQPNIEQRTLTVTYDSMVIAQKNIEYTIAGAGFDANSIPAATNAAAALSAECK